MLFLGNLKFLLRAHLSPAERNDDANASEEETLKINKFFCLFIEDEWEQYSHINVNVS